MALVKRVGVHGLGLAASSYQQIYQHNERPLLYSFLTLSHAKWERLLLLQRRLFVFHDAANCMVVSASA